MIAETAEGVLKAEADPIAWLSSSLQTLDLPQPNAGGLSVMTEFWRGYTTLLGAVRISNDQQAIRDVLAGKTGGSTDVRALALHDQTGSLNPQSPLIDAIRMYLTNEQVGGRRAFGKEMLEYFEAPPYGWDPNAVRVGVAAMVRAGSVKVVLNKKVYTNPDDPDLVNALRVSSNFKKAELELEETTIPPETLTEVRLVLINLAKTRKIEETPAALAEAAGTLGDQLLEKVNRVELWARGSGAFLLTKGKGVAALARQSRASGPRIESRTGRACGVHTGRPKCRRLEQTAMRRLALKDSWRRSPVDRGGAVSRAISA